MENVKVLSSKVRPDAVEISLQMQDGSRKEITMSRTDFMLIRLQIDQQARADLEKQSNPGAKPLHVVHPKQITVLQNMMSNNPVLVLGLDGLGQLPIEIPQSGLAQLMQLLLPYLSQGKEAAAGKN